MDSNHVVRKPKRLTKDRAKALVAAGLHRAVQRHGKDELALEGGCSERCVEKALAHETLPEVHTLGNMLLLDATVLDEFCAALGFRVVPMRAVAANDLATAAGLADVCGEIVRAWADGKRQHPELLAIADRLRPLMPALNAIIREADELRGAA